MRLTSAAKSTLITFLFLMPVSPVLGGELSAVFNGKSYHLGAAENWNEHNYGLGLEYQFDTESRWKSILMANGFRDSDDNMSYMAGGGIYRNFYATDRLQGFYIDAGINAFLMTRKDVNDNRPFPGVLPSVTIGNRYMGFNLTYLPKSSFANLSTTRMRDKTIRGIIFLQFKVNVSQMLLAE